MTNFLLNLFVKNHRQTEDPSVRSAIGRLAGFTGIACNTLMFLGKLIVGIIAALRQCAYALYSALPQLGEFHRL